MTSVRAYRTRLAAVTASLALILVVAGCTAPPSAEPGATTAPASASTSAPPVSVEELGKGEQSAAVDVEVGGPAQVVFRRITIRPGAGTGQHCHAGQLVAVVEQGELTHYAPVYPGGVHVYRTGDSIVEARATSTRGRTSAPTTSSCWSPTSSPKGSRWPRPT